MRKLHLSIIAMALALMPALSLSFTAGAQDWANLGRYGDADAALAARTSDPGFIAPVVIMGDSITDNWVKYRPAFFFANGIIGRGISGQTTPQMLIRFRNDVVNVGARTVVILAGTNDIAGNQGPVTREQIMDNLASMCDIARENGIRPILCSVLPAHKYYWKGGLDKHPEIEIPKLNALLKSYAEKEKITYVDFFSPMVDSNPDNLNGLPLEYSKDGVHPTARGYEVMEDILLGYLKKELKPVKKAEKPGDIRLMTYNICHAMGIDKNIDYNRVAAVISDSRPYAVALQELDSATVRSNGMATLGQLAYRTGMYGTFAPAIDFQGGKYGIGMLSLEEPLRYEYVPLPGREESRTLLMVELPRCIYCCTHLSLTEADRLASVEIIAEAVKRFAAGSDKPVFIAGDWNDSPDSEALKAIGRDFTILTDPSANTFPSNAPRSTIDYIAVLKDGAPVSKATPEVVAASLASDHRPVVLSVRLK